MRPQRSLGAVASAYFTQNTGDVILNCAFCQMQVGSNFFIGEANLRRSVLEYFTNSSGENMFAADHIVNNFAVEHSGLVYDLHYHMAYPQEDPMNVNNPLPPSIRAFNYGVPDVPYAVLNGGASSAYRFNLTPPVGEINEEVLIESSLETPVFELFLTVD